MDTNYHHTDVIMDWMEALHWADKRQLLLVTTGRDPKRNRRMEIDLRRLSQRKRLRAIYYGKKLVYALPRKTKKQDEFEMMSKIYHGLACSETLVRFYLSEIECEIIPERFFRRFGAVPEWGIKWNGELLLGEFSTKSNFLYHELMKGKLIAYIKNLPVIEEMFQARATVVFVLDVPRETVSRFVGNLERSVGSVADGEPSALSQGDTFPFNPFFFTDYQTFLSVPLREQLSSPIYFWIDGKEYPIKKND